MEQHLGITSFRLPPPEGGLAELASSPLFAGGAADAHSSGGQCLEPAQLAAWARSQRQQPLTALDWRVVLGQLAGGKGAQQIVSLLSWAAEGAVQQLKLAASGRAAQGGGSGDAGNPRQQLALQNTLKLSLAFLCCISRGQSGSSQAEQEHGQQAGTAAAGGARRKKAKGGGGGGTAAAAADTTALAQLQLRCDALQAVLAISEAFASGSPAALLPAVSDLRAAERLWRASAVHCLVHPSTAAAAAAGSSGTRGSAKTAMEAAYRALAGILSRPFLVASAAADAAPAAAAAAPAAPAAAASVAAAHTLQELLVIVTEPKQAPQVLAAVVRLLGGLMQQSSRCAVAVARRLTQRCLQLAAECGSSSSGLPAGSSHVAAAAAPAATAALVGQRLDACLHFATLLATSGAVSEAAPIAGPHPPVASALLLCMPRLLPLARLGRSSTRRQMLELCSALLPAAGLLHQAAQSCRAATGGEAAPQTGAAGQAVPGPAPAYQEALLAALCSGASDRDATLRAKALGCLERHAQLLAEQLGSCGTAVAGAAVIGAAGCSGAAAAEAGAGAEPAGGSPGSSRVGGVSGALLQALHGRLLDKSPSVRKRALSLLSVLTLHIQQQQRQPGGEAPARLAEGCARLAEAVLPVASQLLGLRPDSALHPGEEGVKALSDVVLRLAARGSSAASLLPLLQLAGTVGEAAAQAQLQGDVLDVLLPPAGSWSSSGAIGGVLLDNLAAVLPQCSRQQVEQLRQAVQATLAAGSRGAGVAAAVSSAMRLCYQRLHAAVAGDLQAAWPGLAADGANGERLAGSKGEPSVSELGAAAACGSCPRLGGPLALSLFVLGPFSSADTETRVAEAGLLISCMHRLAAAAADTHGGSAASSRAEVCWLLAALALGLLQLHPEGAPSSAPAASQGAEGHWQDSHMHPSQQPPVGAQSAASAALMEAVPEAVHALLLSPAGSCGSVRQAALGVVMALPAAAQTPLRLLQALTQVCSISSAAAAAARSAKPAEPPLLLAIALESAPPPEDGSGSGSGSATATLAASAGGSMGGHGDSPRVRLHALLAVLELLGGMAAGYEQQRADFQQQLAAEAEHQQHQQPGSGHGAHQQQVGKSKAGRPLRPASEWWVGDGQHGSPQAGGAAAATKPGDSSEAAAAAAGAATGGAPCFDYMRGEDQAAKQEAAAQLYLDSLLAAADTPPACFLPLLEQLAGDEAAPPAVQAAALRALGRLAVLSEPLCCSAVQLAERFLCSMPSTSSRTERIAGHSHSGSNSRAEVQQAAVSLLAEAIDAHPNRFGGKLLLIGQLMVPESTLTGGPVTGGLSGAAGASAPASGSKPAESAEQLARVAAGAYCRLLLRNKLKLQDQGMLRPVGCALAGGSACVAAIVRHALCQLLQAAPPKDRARLCLDLFHQTPLERGWRQLLAEELGRPGSGLLSDADLRADVLASQALQALLSAAGAASAARAAPADAEAGIAAAGALLRAMRPSAKVLTTLSVQLQAGSGAGTGGTTLSKLPLPARQALAAFVRNHVPAAGAGAGEADEMPAEHPQASGAAPGGGPAAAQKRKRMPGGSAALQQQLLQVLVSGSGEAGGGCGRHAGRPPRRAATAGLSRASAALPTLSLPGQSNSEASRRATAG